MSLQLHSEHMSWTNCMPTLHNFLLHFDNLKLAIFSFLHLCFSILSFWIYVFILSRSSSFFHLIISRSFSFFLIIFFHLILSRSSSFFLIIFFLSEFPFSSYQDVSVLLIQRIKFSHLILVLPFTSHLAFLSVWSFASPNRDSIQSLWFLLHLLVASSRV